MTRKHTLNQPEQFFIDRIRQKPPDGGDFVCGEQTEEHERFNVWQVSYRSQSLRISGLMARPHGDGPFPAVIINHGFFPPDRYYPGKGTKHELRALASRGYLTIAPDYRNYGSSDAGETALEPGFLHDVRNLAAALKELQDADSSRIAMMGHSMGAGLTLQCLATTTGIRAAALLGAVTGREAERYEARRTRWARAPETTVRSPDLFSERYGTPETAPESFEQMSVINYLDAVDAPVIMHHGENDVICPVHWATEICDKLKSHGRDVAFYLYPDTGHVFRDAAFEAMIERNDRFFRAHMTIDDEGVTL